MKLSVLLLVDASFACGYIAHHQLDAMKAKQNIELVKNSFNIFKAEDTVSEIAKYHSKDYMQYSDGETLNYDGLVKHILHLKTLLASPVEILYDTVIAQGDVVCTAHRAMAEKKDGSHVEIKVLALHTIKDGKIISTDELTHVIKGAKEDQALGSVH